MTSSRRAGEMACRADKVGQYLSQVPEKVRAAFVPPPPVTDWTGTLPAARPEAPPPGRSGGGKC
jgi:hypothetical protein